MRERHALIVTRESERRGRIKLVIRESGYLFATTSAKTLLEAINVLNAVPEPVSLVFIGSDYGFDEIWQFIADARKCDKGSCASYVLIIYGEDKTAHNRELAQLKGADAVIAEPYSIQEVERSIASAFKRSEELRRQRERRSIGRIVREAMKFIDVAAERRKAELEPGDNHRSLREVGEAIRDIKEERLEDYNEIAIALFETAQPPPQDTGFKTRSPALKRMLKKRKGGKIPKA